jgi:hypothetical protein
VAYHSLAYTGRKGNVMKKIATFVKRCEWGVGEAQLWKVSEPVEYDDGKRTEFIAVSAARVPYSGPETYIFPADEEGNVLDWGELDGSYRGGLDHREAIRGAGYTIQ